MLRGPKVSACMVLYKSGPESVDAVRCVLASSEKVDLHIVDNASGDGMLKTLRAVAPSASFYEMQKNLGFGAANNVVISHIKSEYHLMLNPDVTFDPELIGEMAVYMDRHPDIGILTPRLVFPDGQEQYVPRMEPSIRRMLGGKAGRFFPPAQQWRDEYTLRGMPVEEPMKVEVASGCFLMIRTKLLFRLKGFDERFFLYLEDTDLSHRAGLKSNIVYHPGFVVTHSWHRDSAHHFKAALRHARSAFKYFRKWGWRW